MKHDLCPPKHTAQADDEWVGRCKLMRPGQAEPGKQELLYSGGISAESVGSTALHMQLLLIPPLARAKAHKHAGHETGIYALRGVSGCWYGEALEYHAWVQAGDFFYIPRDVPHLPYNPDVAQEFVALVARTDPNEQESVVLLPELDSLTHIRARETA